MKELKKILIRLTCSKTLYLHKFEVTDEIPCIISCQITICLIALHRLGFRRLFLAFISSFSHNLKKKYILYVSNRRQSFGLLKPMGI